MIKPIPITTSVAMQSQQNTRKIYYAPKFTLNPNRYLVPIKRYKAWFPINLEVIVPAINPHIAMYLAKEEFEKDGWIVDEDYKKYKMI